MDKTNCDHVLRLIKTENTNGSHPTSGLIGAKLGDLVAANRCLSTLELLGLIKYIGSDNISLTKEGFVAAELGIESYLKNMASNFTSQGIMLRRFTKTQYALIVIYVLSLIVSMCLLKLEYENGAYKVPFCSDSK